MRAASALWDQVIWLTAAALYLTLPAELKDNPAVWNDPEVL
jgi:hypothetical protein